ncbi:hypothetical protein DQP56_10290 [Mycolicibacter senuensis]|nr:hypothetical protein DQP56_10290 [Mycolicibacter senuensis]
MEKGFLTKPDKPVAKRVSETVDVFNAATGTFEIRDEAEVEGGVPDEAKPPLSQRSDRLRRYNSTGWKPLAGTPASRGLRHRQ